jgi:hypothetical protein
MARINLGSSTQTIVNFDRLYFSNEKRDLFAFFPFPSSLGPIGLSLPLRVIRDFRKSLYNHTDAKIPPC